MLNQRGTGPARHCGRTRSEARDGFRDKRDRSGRFGDGFSGSSHGRGGPFVMAVLFGAMGCGGLSQTPSADADGASPKLRDMAMPRNRAIEYRHKAQECRLKAEATKLSETKQSWWKLAAQWERLAQEIHPITPASAATSTERGA